MQTIEVSTPTIKVKIGDTELVLSQEEATALRDSLTAAMPKPPTRTNDAPLQPIRQPNPSYPSPWRMPGPTLIEREHLKYVGKRDPNITVTFCSN